MLIHKARSVVDLVVDDHVQVLLGGMVLDLRVREFLRHRYDCVLLRLSAVVATSVNLSRPFMGNDR